MSALPLPRETLPGLVHGIVEVRGDLVTVQCDRCYETHTDWTIFAVSWAPIRDGQRICRDCQETR